MFHVFINGEMKNPRIRRQETITVLSTKKLEEENIKNIEKNKIKGELGMLVVRYRWFACISIAIPFFRKRSGTVQSFATRVRCWFDVFVLSLDRFFFGVFHSVFFCWRLDNIFVC